MPASARPVLSSNEAKLLFTLLDAAQEEGRLRGTPFEPRWLEFRRLGDSFAKVDRAALFHLVAEVDASGLLRDTWMRERWLAVTLRVERDPMDHPPSQAPFPPRNTPPAAGAGPTGRPV